MDGSISFRYNPSLPLSLFLLHCYLSLYPAAIEKGNELLLKHHPGVYGLTNKDRWSCCGRARRECEGCSDSRGALKMLGKSPDGKYREEEERGRGGGERDDVFVLGGTEICNNFENSPNCY